MEKEEGGEEEEGKEEEEVGLGPVQGWRERRGRVSAGRNVIGYYSLLLDAVAPLPPSLPPSLLTKLDPRCFRPGQHMPGLDHSLLSLWQVHANDGAKGGEGEFSYERREGGREGGRKGECEIGRMWRLSQG